MFRMTLMYSLLIVLWLLESATGFRAILTTQQRPPRQVIHRRHRRPSLSLTPNDDDDAQDSTASEFELLQEVLYRQEMNRLRESTWLASIESLPFECTECGNCCRTEGNVFLSPEEHQAASDYKNMTVSEFIEAYACKTIKNKKRSDSDNENDNLPWVLIKNKVTENGPACIFLDPITHHCSIYPVRPIQCSTYPFWPNILESEQKWNDEVRRKDADTASPLPVWTAKGGGCEGMQLLNSDDDDTDKTEMDGVPIDDALRQLSLYQRSDRRMPRNNRNDGQ